MQSELSLEAVCHVISRIKKRRGCLAKDITKTEITEELRTCGVTASNSTSGPLIRAAQDEAILAETLSTDNIPSYILAAYHRDRKHVAGEAAASVRQLTQKEADEHEKVLAALQRIKEEVNGLRELASNEESKRRVAENALAEALGRISTFNSTIELKDNSLKDLSAELTHKRDEASEAKAENKRIRDKLDEALSRERELEARLKNAERDTEEARQVQARAEQRVLDLGDMNRELKEQNKTAEGRERILSDELKTYQQKLQDALTDKADALARLDERGKKTDSAQNPSTTKNADGKFGPGSGKK